MRNSEYESPLKPYIIERKPEVLISQQQSQLKRAISNSDFGSLPRSGGASSNNHSMMSNISNHDMMIAIKQLPYSRPVA